VIACGLNLIEDQLDNGLNRLASVNVPPPDGTGILGFLHVQHLNGCI
jgi:hypothetical protein